MIVEGIVVLVTLFLVMSVHKYVTRPSNLPPGPTPLPILGNLFSVTGSDSFLATVNKLKEKYGDIYTLEIRGTKMVFISCGTMAREALLGQNMDKVAGRPQTFRFHYFTDGAKDVIGADFSPALMWRRKIMHSGLRMYTKNLSGIIVEDVTRFEEKLKTGVPLDAQTEITFLILNILCAFLVGKSFDKEDPEFKKILEFMNILARLPATGSIVDVFPWLIHFPLEDSKKVKRATAIRNEVLWKIFQEHKDTFEEDNVRDLTDAFLKANIEIERQDRKAVGEVTDEHLRQFLSDLFIGGVETTTTALRWAMAYLINYPEIQARAQAEIDDVIGDRWPTVSDLPNLPYLEAIIAEVLRIAVFPLGVPRKANFDTQVGGYTIPEGALVFFNIWAIQHDPKDWERPHQFDPSRFIDGDGKFQTPAGKNFLPFGYGRRICIGESLAKSEMFLILSRLLQHFTFVPPEGSPPPDLEGVSGFTLFPKPYSICARERGVLKG